MMIFSVALKVPSLRSGGSDRFFPHFNLPAAIALPGSYQNDKKARILKLAAFSFLLFFTTSVMATGVNNRKAHELAEGFNSRKIQGMRACFYWRAEGTAKDLAIMKARWRGGEAGSLLDRKARKRWKCQRSISRESDL